MTESLSALETRRAELLHSIADLKDMRPGSIVGAVFRCGNLAVTVPSRRTRGTGPTYASPTKCAARP